MKLRIDARIFELFPSTVLGVIVAKDIDNAGIAKDIPLNLDEVRQEIRQNYHPETLSQNARIDAWRKAYSAFGAKPKEHKSSIENLMRAALQGNQLRHINKIVDIYNYISLKHIVPVGGEDIDKLEGDVQLTLAGDDEPAVLLLGDKEPRKPHAGEVIYKDDVSAICRRWNWREADRTKLTEDTKNCILVIEGIAPITRAEVEKATLELEQMVQEICGGAFFHAILDTDCREIEL